MTEDEARDWIGDRFGSGACAHVGRFLAMVVEENQRQNLIAPSTLALIWQRHAVDSAQLLAFDRPGEVWLDVGTGGGFPGMVVALLRDGPVVMVEPRARRAAFLADAVAALGLSTAQVVCGKVERWTGHAGIVSARAVSSMDTLLSATQHCTGPMTRWILPKGRTARDDLAVAQRTWNGVFHVEQSIVEAEAGIIVAERLKPR